MDSVRELVGGCHELIQGFVINIFGADFPHGVEEPLHLFVKEVALVRGVDLEQFVDFVYDARHLLRRDDHHLAQHLFNPCTQAVLGSVSEEVRPQNLLAGGFCRCGRAVQAFGRQPGELCGLMEIYLSSGERIRHVGREFEDGKILADKAIEGDSARCFTIEDGFEPAGGFDELFARPS